MIKTLHFRLLALFIVLQMVSNMNAFAQKSIYIPSSFGGMDLNSTSSQWCYARSQQSEDFIIFWEAGYGTSISNLMMGNYTANITNLLNLAESGYKYYRDSLKFASVGSSKTDTYKMIILVKYTTDWICSGSGVDDQIGLLTLSAWAASAGGVALVHEVAHCFQYQTFCDVRAGGWRYGFGVNGADGNCWWEQCAQWQAFNVTGNKFADGNFSNYLNSAHKHILHETPRYANYFIQDYWTYLHGLDFIGRLWRESRYPEDPIDAYKRLNNISQTQFNDEIYDCAARLVTWDIPSIRNAGKDYISARTSSPMTLTSDKYWLIDASKCIENYGYNTIRLNVPTNRKIKVYFEGKAGETGFRVLNKNSAGWRYGIVALLKDGTRVYSSMRSPSFDVTNSLNPKDTLSFTCPANCAKLWLVVTGAPTSVWHHAWDDDDTNDEQWPYQVKFENTNLFGVYNFTSDDVPHNETITQNLTLKPVTVAGTYPVSIAETNIESVCKAFALSFADVKSSIGTSIKYAAIQPDGNLNYTSTATAPGHWFNSNGYTTNFGNNSYIFSEFRSSTLQFYIGQYPNLCKDGDKYTIRQALVYTPVSGNPVTVSFVFNITISSTIATNSVSDAISSSASNFVVPVAQATLESVASTQASIDMQSNVDGKLYYLILNSTEAIPSSAEQVVETANGNLTNLADVALNFQVADLEPETNYKLYIVAEDKNQEVGAITSVDFTTITKTSIHETHTNSISLFPNPATDEVKILNKSLNLDASVYTEQGQQLFTTHSSTFEVRQLPDGIYFVRIGTFTEKLIIKH